MRHPLAAALLALWLPFSLGATPVAQVLTEDPPLPGEPLTGWEALEPAAESHAGLSAAEAVALSRARSPELQALRAELAAARGALLEARAVPNPTVEVALRSISSDDARVTPTQLSAELALTELLRAPLRAAAARPEVQAARLRLEEASLQLGYAAQAAWFEAWAAEAAWGAALRAVDGLAASRDAQRALTAAGNAPTRALALKEIAYEEARSRAAGLEVERFAARERLTRLIGQDPGPLGPLPPLVAPPLPEDLESVAVARSLALQVLELNLRAAVRSRTAARVEGLAPDVGVSFGAERQAQAWDATAGLTLSVPLLSLGRGEIARASAAVDRQAALRAAEETAVRSAAREARLRFASAAARARHSQEVLLPAHAALLAETLLHSNAMQLDLDALLDAWRGRVEAEIAAASALREAHTAAAALDALLAGARVAPPRAAIAPNTLPDTAGAH